MTVTSPASWRILLQRRRDVWGSSSRKSTTQITTSSVSSSSTSLCYHSLTHRPDKFPLAVRPFYTMPDPDDPVRASAFGPSTLAADALMTAVLQLFRHLSPRRGDPLWGSTYTHRSHAREAYGRDWRRPRHDEGLRQRVPLGLPTSTSPSLHSDMTPSISAQSSHPHFPLF